MKKILLKAVFVSGVLITLHTLDVQAQNGHRNGNPNQPSNCGNCQGNNGRGKGNSVPIDGGAGILLAAGAAYGLKKIRDYRISKAGKDPSA